jgi:hypothetical protein
MSTVESILKLLEQVPAWKRVKDAADRIDGLESRIAELESRLRRAAGEACPRCGALEYRVTASKPARIGGEMGVLERTKTCGECKFSEMTLFTGSANR